MQSVGVYFLPLVTSVKEAESGVSLFFVMSSLSLVGHWLTREAGRVGGSSEWQVPGSTPLLSTSSLSPNPPDQG